MKRYVIFFLVVAVAIPSQAMAQGGRRWGDHPCRDCNGGYGRTWDSGPGAYATMMIGAYMPQDKYDLLEDGSSIGLALGSHLTENFALEIGMHYDCADFRWGGDDEAYVSTFSVPVTAKVVAPLTAAVDVFAGAGLGVYFLEVRDGSLWYGDPDDMQGYDDTSLGIHTVIGSDIYLNPNLALCMELKYMAIARDSDDEFHDVLGLDGTTATVGVKFRF